MQLVVVFHSILIFIFVLFLLCFKGDAQRQNANHSVVTISPASDAVRSNVSNQGQENAVANRSSANTLVHAPPNAVSNQGQVNVAANRSNTNPVVRVQPNAVSNRGQVNVIANSSNASHFVGVQAKAVSNRGNSTKGQNENHESDIDEQEGGPDKKKKKTANSKEPSPPVYNIHQAMALQIEANNLLKRIVAQNDIQNDLLTKLLQK